jgi:cytochrome b561
MRTDRYTNTAIVLHWLIAAAILFMIPLGFWMHRAILDPADRALAYKAFQFHKSLGLTILALSLLRLAWRFTHAPPPLPAPMPAWEKLAARTAHWLFYVLMIAMPLTGWLYVSTGWSLQYGVYLNVPTVWFGLFQIPHLPFFENAADAARKAGAVATLATHWALAWGAVALIALHVAAALKHQFVDRDETMAHMAPFFRLRKAAEPLKELT